MLGVLLPKRAAITSMTTRFTSKLARGMIMNQSNTTELMAMHTLLASRQDEILGSICKLVETESPSGDFEGSRAVVDLLVEIARTIPAIS